MGTEIRSQTVMREMEERFVQIEQKLAKIDALSDMVGPWRAFLICFKG